jgi:hypothetical protein
MCDVEGGFEKAFIINAFGESWEQLSLEQRRIRAPQNRSSLRTALPARYMGARLPIYQIH